MSEPSDEERPSDGEEAESMARLLELTGTMPPEYAELLPFHSRFLLHELKRQDSLEQAIRSPKGWVLTWYLWKTDEPVRIEMQPVVGDGTCSGQHLGVYALNGGSRGFEVVEIPVIAEDCP